MRTIFVLLAVSMLSITAHATERRCGWLQNPTPANYWLTDADGTWIIMAQGGYEAPGADNLPPFDDDQYVKTNGNYGYGCACLDVTVDRRTEQVTYLAGGKSLKLSKCLQDERLPRPY